ncbi:GNAT family N-acetyltransferase [Anaerocolumna jejuensis]|uniref:GNAT family N-acetyltransferase n=1 Tax=Anaerocolumna jejuensis TaxID=259063 RepID=UPI003F7C11D8
MVIKMKLQIEKVISREDMEQLAQLARKIWNEYYIQILSREQIAYMVEKFQSVGAITDQIENQGFEYYNLRPGGAAAGYIGIKAQGDGSLFLSKLYISKEYRGMGYAKEAMDFITELCKERGLNKMWLTVNRYNDNSIKVYEKMGFHIVRAQVANIGNGYSMDDYIMEKNII